MRKTFKRTVSMLLAVLMLSSLGLAAFAATPDHGGVDTDHGGSGSLVDGPAPAPDGDVITFMPANGYELDPAKGTYLKPDDSIDVPIKFGHVKEKMIPDAIEADEFYKVATDKVGDKEVIKWAVKDENGNLKEIDILKYKFKDEEEVYAIYEDLWKPYKDMKQDRSDWFYINVRDLSIDKVIAGYPDNTFAPHSTTTWGEALKLIMRAAGYKDQPSEEGQHWAIGYLRAARKDRLVPADKKIDLTKPITRLEYAEVASKALNLANVKIKTPFTDTDAQEVLNLYDAKIVEGSFDLDGNRVFKPDDYITRAEISAIIWRINEYNK